jgi:hypothetical protein
MKTALRFLQAILLRLLVLAVAAIVTTATAQAQTFKLDKAAYETGQSLTATWTGGPGNPTDWVGIYQEGQTPGSVGSTLWYYVNGTRTATSGLTDGSVTFANLSLAPGNWVAHFLSNDGYDAITDPVPFAIEGVNFSSFTADASIVSPGTPVILSWVIDPNGQPTPTATLTGGSAPVDVTGLDFIEVTPSVTTTYTLKVGTTATRSVSVAVFTGNSPAFSLSATTLTADIPLSITWSGGPANTTDWIGIYRVGDTPGPIASTLWWYTNGTRTATEGLASGTVSFPPSLAPGEYFAAFFLNDGYSIAFGPVAFTVTAAPFAVTNFAILETGEISLTWASDPNAPVLFDVQESTDLATWKTVDAAASLSPAPDAGTTTATFLPTQSPASGPRFYRVKSTGQ